MKKTFFLIAGIFFASLVFAADYEDLIQQGKDYEAKKQWFYALGSYYDAMQLSDNPEEAKAAYENLSNTISEGKPGYGDFDVFELHEGWIALIKDAEQYFTENFPYKVTYNGIESDVVDYENKTFSYNLSLTAEYSDMYKNAIEILRKGYNNNNHTQWTDLESPTHYLWFLENSYTGIHNTGTYHNDCWVNNFGASVYTKQCGEITEVEEFPILQEEAETVYENNKVALSYFASILATDTFMVVNDPNYNGVSICETPAFAAKFGFRFVIDRGFLFAGKHEEMTVDFKIPVFKGGKITCYDMVLGIFDENDELIATGGRQNVRADDPFFYKIDGISQEENKLIDPEKIRVKVLRVWLNYGVYDILQLYEEDYKNNLATINGMTIYLPDIPMELEKVKFIDKKRQEQEAKRRAGLEEIRKDLDEWENYFSSVEEKCNEYDERVRNAPEKMKKVFESFGISYTFEDGFLKVTKVKGGSVASKAMITSGSILTKVGGSGIEDILSYARSYRATYMELRNQLAEAKSYLARMRKEMESDEKFLTSYSYREYKAYKKREVTKAVNDKFEIISRYSPVFVWAEKSPNYRSWENLSFDNLMSGTPLTFSKDSIFGSTEHEMKIP